MYGNIDANQRELNLKSPAFQTALSVAHPEWRPGIEQALTTMDPDYLQSIAESKQWLPGLPHLFAAFSQPFNSVRYVLLGESPYPRKQSANGYAFWDAAVGELWSDSGLNKTVNRATSLRNLLKMLMYARKDLQEDFSQSAIARVDKTNYVRTLAELFQALLGNGFLLLNASLVYEPKRVTYHAKHWRPFMASIFQYLHQADPNINLILLGNIAQQIAPTDLFPCFLAEHPYVISFIRNPDVVSFFQPFNLLVKHK
ncbi:MAG: uracil-DNA glycosylase [Gammaproteobacteria bacterium]|jgi:uracil-DNA glycosylase|nr:uracil-DNA glycosylase [Gammaproteobacteria bacterium]